ncbi:MAG: Macrolide export protein MacA [Syntrophorhabdus sp. PtaB.Bin006]|nr:MAG: Macrolide export protein MacA [Syntrophorhabdus sp. PtaB.Bin006]
MKSNIDPESDIAKNLEIGESHQRSKWLKRSVFIALGLIVVIIIAVIVKTRGNSTATQYRTGEVSRGDLTIVVTATGNLQPTNTVEVGSELSGIVKKVEVNYNSTVKVGQVLATLDTTKLDAQLTQSRAALESAKAKALQVQATVKETQAKLSQYQKVRELSNKRVPSQSEMDAAEAAFERAKADAASAVAAISQAQATVRANETDLSKSVIRSPINGVVLTRSVEPGQTVAASFQAPVLFTLAEDLTQMELHVNVDEADVGKVQEGQKATFTVAAYPNRTFEARITQARYSSSTTSGVVTYETVLKVNNRDLALRPGMTATADITVKQIENAILIPSAALRFAPPIQQETKTSGGLVGALLPRPPRSGSQQHNNDANKKQQKVWILKDKQLSAVPITIGSSNGGMTEVVAGDIQPGMSVAVDVITSTK